MSTIAVISIFICLVGLQISAQDLQTAQYRREQSELYAKENGHQIVASSHKGSSYSGGHGQSGYSNSVYGEEERYADPYVSVSLSALYGGYVLARKLKHHFTGTKVGQSRSVAENVGSPKLNDYRSYQAPVMPVPLYTYSYPSPAAQVKCGNALLISCRPTYQVTPCSAYSLHGV